MRRCFPKLRTPRDHLKCLCSEHRQLFFLDKGHAGASILRRARHGVRLNEHPDGLAVFQHAYKMSLEGIVSKRLGSRYRSGRSPDWLKFKKPGAPAVKREAEEDWGR